jgi:lipoprotein-anchoring transpeptidase ErfK/SrfK
MLKRIPVIAALTGLALTGALCACGSAAQHSAGAGASTPSATATPAKPSSPDQSSSPAPGSGVPVIFAVRLGSGFQPNTLRISRGQHFVVTVDSSVKASGPGVPSSCPGTTAPIDGGLLTVRCTSGAFYYTAQRPGTAELMATVRPNCAQGSMCPQWIAEATLKITIL